MFGSARSDRATTVDNWGQTVQCWSAPCVRSAPCRVRMLLPRTTCPPIPTARAGSKPWLAWQRTLEERVVSLKSSSIVLIHERRFKQGQECVGVFGLGVQRVEARPLARTYILPRPEPLRVELGTLPSIVDRRQGRWAHLRGDDTDDHPTAIALRIVAVELHKAILAYWQLLALENGDRARFLRGHVRASSVKRN